MFETTMFTPRAQQVVQVAQKIAEKAGNKYAGTEHLLMAMLKIDAGIGSNALKKLGISYEDVEQAIRFEFNPDEAEI